MSLWEVLFRPSSSRSEKYQGEIASAWVLFLLSSWLMCFFHALFEPRRAQQMQHRWIDSLCTRIDAVHITYRWTMNFYFSLFQNEKKKKGVWRFDFIRQDGVHSLFSFFLSIGMFSLLFFIFFAYLFFVFRHFQSRVVLLLFDGFPNENRH